MEEEGNGLKLTCGVRKMYLIILLEFWLLAFGLPPAPLVATISNLVLVEL